MTNGGNQPGEDWRFVVLFAKTSFHAMEQGLFKSYGVLIPVLVNQLDTTYAMVGFLLSLQHVMGYMACPLAQLVIQIWDPRLVATVGGLGCGLALIGCSFTRSVVSFGTLLFISGVFMSSLVQVSAIVLRQHFGDKFGSAASVSFLGTLIGGMTLPYLTYRLMDAYGLGGTLLCLGALFLHGCPIGATFRSPNRLKSLPKDAESLLPDPPESENLSPKHVSENRTTEGARAQPLTSAYMKRVLGTCLMAFDIRALRHEPAFALLLMPCKILVDIVFCGWVLFMVSYAIDEGIHESMAVYLPLSGALGGFISRFYTAVMTLYKPAWCQQTFIAFAAVAAVALFMYPVHSSVSYLLVCSVFAGCGIYGLSTTYYGVMSVTVAEENFPGIIAISFFVTGTGVAVSGVLTGYLYDVTGSFESVFRVLAGCMVTVVVLASIYIFMHQHRSRNTRSTNTPASIVRKDRGATRR